MDRRVSRPGGWVQGAWADSVTLSDVEEWLVWKSGGADCDCDGWLLTAVRRFCPVN